MSGLVCIRTTVMMITSDMLLVVINDEDLVQVMARDIFKQYNPNKPVNYGQFISLFTKLFMCISSRVNGLTDFH